MMEIVIKIPEEDYAILLSHADVIRKRKRKTLEEAVINGEPLPEKHGRLIDADAIPRHLVRDIDEIDKQPTIIEGSDAE